MTPAGPIRLALASISVLVALAACNGTSSPPASHGCPVAAPSAEQAKTINSGVSAAEVATNLGSFRIELYPDAAPIATANFVALARCGFYAEITFHRVIPGFVIQAGDPQTKTNRSAFTGLGTGGPGYGFAIEPPADAYQYDPYTVAMANAGQPDTNGSQFFIDLADLNGQLSRSYTIFGKVVGGTDVIDAIGAVKTNGAQDSPTPGDVPLEPVVISSVTIVTGN
jgi:dolichyl-diphosphooligosaccharide--protein glycosyltransferase